MSEGLAAAPAPIIVTALLGAGDQAQFDALRRAHFPPERNHLSAHLTMFHHLMPSLLRELQHRLTMATRGVEAPAAQVIGLMSLGRGTAFKIESPGLHDIRAQLADAFALMLIPQDQVPWRPHITVQNKVAPAEAKALMTSLQERFKPHAIRIAGIGTWWYRGGPWEPIGRHMFR